MKTSKTIMIVLAGLILASCSSKDDEMQKESVRRNVSQYGAVRGSDGEYVLAEGFQPMSTEEFSEILVGQPWEMTDWRRINEDGSIDEKTYWKSMMGATPVHLLFSNETLYFKSLVIHPSGGYQESSRSYTYDESTGKVIPEYNYPVLTILSYDAEKEEAVMIFHLGDTQFSLLTYHRMPMEWWDEMVVGPVYPVKE